MQRKSKVSVAMLAAALLTSGLLVPGPTAPPGGLGPSPVLAQPAQAQDAGHCMGPRRELRFAWLKPGEEPTLPVTGQASVCLAVYEVPGH